MYQTTKDGSEELEGSVEGSKWRIHGVAGRGEEGARRIEEEKRNS